MGHRVVKLEDKYTLEKGRIYLTGVQALVRLPLMQKQRDAAAGLKTAGYISGYRGSPLGTYDSELVKAKKYLDDEEVRFVPGVNEDLAATAIYSANVLKKIVKEGLAATILPVSLFEQETREGSVVAHRITEGGLWRTVGVATGSATPATRCLDAVTRLIVARSRSLSAGSEWIGGRPA
jgi:hypothetical protein